MAALNPFRKRWPKRNRRRRTRWFQKLFVERLEDRTVPSTVTVAVHGASLLGGLRGGPLTEMGEALYDYWSTQGSATLLNYDPADGSLDPDPNRSAVNAEHKIIVFNWQSESDDSAPGYDEAAGDALFAMLVQHGLANSNYLHLIGHSRGAIVVSEAAQRLLSYEFDVHQMTLLDHERGPWPYGAVGDPLAWAGIEFVDNYYGKGSLGLRGEHVDGAHNFYLPNYDHTEVREWYETTIAGLPGEGFELRRDSDRRSNAFIQGFSTRLENHALPSVFNGDFDYGRQVLPTWTDFDFAGWARQGGGGEGQNRWFFGEHGRRLILSNEHDSRTHNRLYIPDEATALVYEVYVPVESNDDLLRVYFNNNRLQDVVLTPSTSSKEKRFSDFETRSIDVRAYQGQVGTLRFEIVSAQGSVDSVVHIDNLWFGTWSIDLSPPRVTLHNLSTFSYDPTIFSNSVVEVFGAATDPESGIRNDSYEFQISIWNDGTRNWDGIPGPGRGASKRTLGPLNDGDYRIILSAENGQGDRGMSAAGYFRVDTEEPNKPPRIGSLSASPASLTKGATLTLTAYGAHDPDGSIKTVTFYRDANGNDSWDSGDETLGNATPNANQEAAITVATGSLAEGRHRFFARAQDNDDAWTPTVVTATATIVGDSQERPTIDQLKADPNPVEQGKQFLLTASGVADADGFVTSVAFYWDSNRNRRWDENDYRLHIDPSVIGGTATAQDWAAYEAGTHRFFARAKDNDGYWSDVRSVDVVIKGKEGSEKPVVHWIDLSSHTIDAGDDLTITWSATDDVEVTHIGLYLYKGSAKVDMRPYGVTEGQDGRLADNAFELVNDGHYRWTVPADLLPANNYNIKIVAWDSKDEDVAQTGYKFSEHFSVVDDDPRLVKLVADPTSFIEGQNKAVALTATVDDAHRVRSVKFALDVNRNNRIDNSDVFLGEKSVINGTAIASYNVAGLAKGWHQFVSQAILDDGSLGPPRTAKILITAKANQPPKIGSLEITPGSVTRGDTITLTAKGLSDDTGIDYVQFLWDFDKSGDASGSDSVLGKSFNVSGGQASLQYQTTRLDPGSQQILARARDVGGKWSEWVSASVTVNNPNLPKPFIGSLDPSDMFLPHPITLKLTANDVSNAANVLFYHDANNNGALDGGDRFLIDDDDGGNGWWWQNSLQNLGLPIGTHRFFAVGKNANGEEGNVVSTVVTTHAVDTTNPIAAVNAPDLVDANTYYEFEVVYTDNIAISTADLDDSDIRVVAPEDVWSASAKLATVDDLVEGPKRIATYRIDARGGTWDGFDNGEYRIYLKSKQVRDTNGNYVADGQIGTFDVTVPFDDSTKPVIELPGFSSDVNNPTPFSNRYVTANGTVSDPESGIDADSFDFAFNSFDGQKWTGWQTEKTATPDKSFGPLESGLYGVYLTAHNGAGMPGQSPTSYFYVDTVVPDKPSVLGLNTDTGASDDDAITAHNIPTFTWTASADSESGVKGYWWAVNDNTPESGGSFTTALSATMPVPADGDHAFYVRAEDFAGNLSLTGSLPFTIDTAQPVVSAISPADGSILGAGPKAVLVDFSEAMDQGTLSKSALSLSGPGLGSAVVDAATWVDANTARFAIGGSWGTGQVFVKVDTGELRDLAGNVLEDYTGGDFTIDASKAPEIVVEDAAGDPVADGAATFGFGSVLQGETAPTKTFTVRNTGTATLFIDKILVPPGFSIAEALDASIAPDKLDTFTLRLDSEVVGPKSGQVRISNNDADENPFNFVVQGEVKAPDGTAKFGFAKQIGGNDVDQAFGITTDAAGNIYVTGTFKGTTDFDPGSGTAPRTSFQNSRDIFVAKYTRAGEFTWVKTYGGDSSDYGQDIAVDASGNVYVTGYFGDTVNFAGQSRTSQGNSDLFALKLDSSGNTVWAFAAGGGSSDSGRGIAVDGSGSVFVTGQFQETVNFGGNSRTAAGFWDAFLLKLNQSGSVSWVRHMGGSNDEVGWDVTVDSAGNAYTTGKFRGTTDFNRDGSAANRSSNGGDDIFIAKHSSSGALQWVHGIGGVSGEQGWSIAADKNNNVYTTGSFQNTVDFNPQSGEAKLTSEGNLDAFVLKLDADGIFGWVHQIGGSSASAGYGITTDSDRDVYVAGYYEGTADFDANGDGFDLTSVGAADVFVTKIDAQGAFGWVKSMGGSDGDYAQAITVDADKRITTTGTFGGTADFDPSNDEAKLTSFGSVDVFLSQLVTPPPIDNKPPELSAIGDRTINEGQTLTFTAKATDPNGGQTLRFSLDEGAPEGASINAVSGLFSWSTNEQTGPFSDQVTVRVTDNGNPAMTDTVTFTITVKEVNRAPVLDALSDKRIERGQTLQFQATASDTDIPADGLTFSLDAGAPKDANIDPATGTFEWIVSSQQAIGGYKINVRVTDDGQPALSDVKEFIVFVTPGDQTMPYKQDSMTIGLATYGQYTVEPAGDIAWFIDSDRNLTSDGNYSYNWGKKGEKWLKGDAGWHFITPKGELYLWDGTPRQASGELIATLAPMYHRFPVLLHDARKEHVAQVLDEYLQLTNSGNFYKNLGGFDELWLLGYNNQWYFITPDGRFFAWNRTAGKAYGDLLFSFDPVYYTEVERLYDAQPDPVTVESGNNQIVIDPVAGFVGHVAIEVNATFDANKDSVLFTVYAVNHAPELVAVGDRSMKQSDDKISIDLAATDGDSEALAYTAQAGNAGYFLKQKYKLHFAGSWHQNYGGQNERWMRGIGGQWHFIKPDGTFWAWDGTPGHAGGDLLHTLDPVFYYFPDLLYDAKPGHLAIALDRRLDLTFTGNDYFDLGGEKEKWLSGGGWWLFIKPDGELWWWNGSAGQASGVMIARLDPVYYSKWQLLHEAEASEIAISIDKTTLTVDPAADFLGFFSIWVSVSDGNRIDDEIFRFSVSEA